MDWFDDYLNALTDPGKTMHLPPDQTIWKQATPNQQQKRMINDSIAFDQQQQMKMIQEARHALEEHGHGMSHADVADGIGADPGSHPTLANAETVFLYFNTAQDAYVYAFVRTTTGYAFVEYWDGTSEVIGYGNAEDDQYFEKYVPPGDPYPAPRLVKVTSCDANGVV